jgi:hypothetical protein
MDLTRNEKLSILHALNEVLIADGEVTENETSLINVVLLNLNLRMSDLIEAKNMDSSTVLNTMRAMNQQKKEFIKGLLSHMALIDGDDNLNTDTQKVVSLFFTFLK